MNKTTWVMVLIACGIGPVSARGHAQPLQPAAAVPAPDEAQLQELVVTGTLERSPLEAAPATGGSLGLTVRETPAVIDVLTQSQIQDLGARGTHEALNRAPGAWSGELATSPGAVSLRGFTGAGRGLLLLYDGVSPIEEAMFTRVMDSWLFERIEILQGAASVDYGQGALAGVVNLVPKHPRLGVRELAAQVGYGSWNSLRAAADANLPLVSDKLAIRPVVAYSRSAGYVDDAASQYLAASLGVKWRPVSAFTADVAVDYSQDDYDTPYFGTPLVPRSAARDPAGGVEAPGGRVLDRSLRKVNYNVRDGIADAQTFWLRSKLSHQLHPSWTLSNTADFYTSDRRFQNAEYFGFNPDTEQVDRSTGIVTHDIQFWIDRLTLGADHHFGAVRNRFMVGAEYSQVELFTERRFGSTSAVDLRRPQRGRFPEGDDAETFGRRQNRDNSVLTAAVFGQDAINVTEHWRITGGLRFDHIAVDRSETDLNAMPRTRTPVERTFHAVTWRVGSSYDVTDMSSVFAQYSTAASPPSSLLTLAPGSTTPEMTRGRAVECGWKGSLFERVVTLGLSGFYIEQDDIMTRSASDPTVSVQGGTRSSVGGELSLHLEPVQWLRVDANYTQFNARFDRLIDEQGESQAGRTPERVPEQILNAFLFVDTPVLPLTASVGVHHVGRYFTDNANTIRIGGQTTLEAAVRYRLALDAATIDITLRGRNLGDALYAGYTDMSPDQLTIAAPRSVDLLVSARL
ncbi:MAG: TonB-dependent siderophore receptor [Polyangiales bacterium]